jgi:hypothetical protein
MYIYIYICIYIIDCLLWSVRVCVYIRVYTQYMCIHTTCVYVYTHNLWLIVCIYIHTHTKKKICISVRTYVYTHANLLSVCVCVYAHTSPLSACVYVSASLTVTKYHKEDRPVRPGRAYTVPSRGSPGPSRPGFVLLLEQPETASVPEFVHLLITHVCVGKRHQQNWRLGAFYGFARAGSGQEQGMAVVYLCTYVCMYVCVGRFMALRELGLGKNKVWLFCICLCMYVYMYVFVGRFVALRKLVAEASCGS